MTETQKAQVCCTFAVQVIYLNLISKFKYVDSFFPLFFPPQHCDRTNRLSTQLTLMRWSELLRLERGFPNAGLQARWPRDIQDKGPWWVEVRPYSRSPSAVVQASKQVWEDLSLHSSKGSQVGELASWVSISPDYSECLVFVHKPLLLFISLCMRVNVRIFALLIDILNFSILECLSKIIE